MSRTRYIGCSLILSLGLFAGTARSQSKMAEAFGNFRHTGDQVALRAEVIAAQDSGMDLRIEIPVLVDIVSYSSNAVEQTAARSEVCMLAYLHRAEGDTFRQAIGAFERHLSEPGADESWGWGSSIVFLDTIFGFQPSEPVLTLTYRMVDHKDPWAQGLALEALASLRPLPPKAKELFRSRMTKKAGIVSGPDLLPHLAPASSDPDVLLIFLAAAEDQDVTMQRQATHVLAGMSQIPPQVAEVFYRLRGRVDLDQAVAANVRSGIDRITHVAPPPGK